MSPLVQGPGAAALGYLCGTAQIRRQAGTPAALASHSPAARAAPHPPSRPPRRYGANLTSLLKVAPLADDANFTFSVGGCRQAHGGHASCAAAARHPTPLPRSPPPITVAAAAALRPSLSLPSSQVVAGTNFKLWINATTQLDNQTVTVGVTADAFEPLPSDANSAIQVRMQRRRAGDHSGAGQAMPGLAAWPGQQGAGLRQQQRCRPAPQRGLPALCACCLAPLTHAPPAAHHHRRCTTVSRPLPEAPDAEQPARRCLRCACARGRHRAALPRVWCAHRPCLRPSPMPAPMVAAPLRSRL